MEASTQREAGPDVDWEEIERSPEFQELVKRRKAFVLPGTIFYLSWYMGFILLVAYAEDFMSRRVYEGLTVGSCLALTQVGDIVEGQGLVAVDAHGAESTMEPKGWDHFAG